MPTLLGFPPLIHEAQAIFGIRGVTSPVNAAGLPALALPVPAAGGPRAANGPLPASVQLIGPAPAARTGCWRRARSWRRRPRSHVIAPGRPRPDPGAIVDLTLLGGYEVADEDQGLARLDRAGRAAVAVGRGPAG